MWTVYYYIGLTYHSTFMTFWCWMTSSNVLSVMYQPLNNEKVFLFSSTYAKVVDSFRELDWDQCNVNVNDLKKGQFTKIAMLSVDYSMNFELHPTAMVQFRNNIAAQTGSLNFPAECSLPFCRIADIRVVKYHSHTDTGMALNSTREESSKDKIDWWRLCQKSKCPINGQDRR